MVLFTNTSHIAICLLNEPFPFLLTKDSIAAQPGALAILAKLKQADDYEVDDYKRIQGNS
jgi:hypothetical protein